MSRLRPFVIHEADCPLEQWTGDSAGAGRWRTLLSADRTPSGSLTLGVAELSADASKEPRLHRHEQPEAYYVLSGEGVVTISGVEHPIRPGCAVFIPGDAEHGAVNTGAGPLRLLYVFPADSFDEVQYRFAEPRGAPADEPRQPV